MRCRAMADMPSFCVVKHPEKHGTTPSAAFAYDRKSYQRSGAFSRHTLRTCSDHGLVQRPQVSVHPNPHAASGICSTGKLRSALAKTLSNRRFYPRASFRLFPRNLSALPGRPLASRRCHRPRRVQQCPHSFRSDCYGLHAAQYAGYSRWQQFRNGFASAHSLACLRFVSAVTDCSTRLASRLVGFHLVRTGLSPARSTL